MGFDLKRFDTFMSKGLSLFTPDFTADYSLATTSTNMLSGMRQGMGPRFGMSPIPAHCHTATKTWSGGSHGFVPAGLMHSEGTSYAMQSRLRFFGVLPIRLADTVNPAATKTFFAWLTGFTSTAAVRLDIGIGSEQTGFFNTGSDYSICTPTSDITAGIPTPSIYGCAFGYVLQNHPALSMFYFKSFTGRRADLESLLYYPTKYYISYDSITVSGKDIPQKNVVGATITQGSATVTAFPNFVSDTSNLNPFGVPSWINMLQYPAKLRNVKFQTILDASAGTNPAGLVAGYEYKNLAWTAATAIAATRQVSTTAQINLPAATTVTGRTDAVALATNATQYVLMQDPENTTNSAYSAILSANGNAVACLLQPWNTNFDGTLNQWADLTSPLFSVPQDQTYDEYMRDAVGAAINLKKQQTSWANWRDFTRGSIDPAVDQRCVYRAYLNVPTYSPAVQICIGRTNSGILRAGIVYEFAFSLYNKRLNYETNVGSPAKLQVPVYTTAGGRQTVVGSSFGID